MAEPRVVPRDKHTLSRRDIDPDALKVLHRLRQFGYFAYLVGGSVRDLLLGRRPKDFDIGTSAHPYQVKKLFRNCWIIGRRFRLAHVKFGSKTIEVATFRRQVAPGEEIVQGGVPVPARADTESTHPAAHEQTLHRDNTFGTPEEDAFRRDFTINALFYDIATLSVIDYVTGLDDLRAGIVRCIGDPNVRFREDPVRMLRAIALAARLDFAIDQPILDAIGRLRHEIAKSSAPRLLEEYYKILRNGSSETTFRGLAQLGLLEPISAELHRGAAEPLWKSLAAVDAYRRRFESTPETLTNAILLGSLLVPLGLSPESGRDRSDAALEGDRRLPAARLGGLPLARRDVERLRQILALQRRLVEVSASPRTKRALAQRGIFPEALTWLDVHGHVPDIVGEWNAMRAESGEPGTEPFPPAPVAGDGRPRRRRRRRRRRPSLPTQGQ
jgi:poly(A) polymerase